MKLTLKQAKRIMQLLNSIEVETIEHFKERDTIVSTLEWVKEIKEYKENFATKAKEVVDGYNEALKEPFKKMQEELDNINEMEKITKSPRGKTKLEEKKNNVMSKYNADITELKKVWDVKLKNVENEVLDSLKNVDVVDIELPSRFTISSSDYESFFKTKTE